MKIFSLLLAFISFTAIAQKPCNCLCAANETNVYSFQTTSKKTVSLCKEKSEKYLVYRFGTPEKTELQFPEQLDESSWKKFTYQFYMRGGGPQNAGMDLNSLSFANKDVKYAIYSDYTSEDNVTRTGITVMLANGKTVDIKGSLPTQTGSLANLRDNTKIVIEDY